MIDLKENLDLRERISEAIEKLRYERDTYNDESEIFVQREGAGKFTREWLCKSWQINMDIDKLNELMFDLKHNIHLVSQKRIDSICDRLSDKYGVEV
jgi:hypothetical protein